MRKIHKATTFALALDLAAISCFLLDQTFVAALLAVLAFFSALSELSRYTSWYQFTTIFVSAVLAGALVDLPFDAGFPFVTIALLFAAFASITRIVFFRTFSYTSYSWFEPLTAGASLLCFIAALFLGHYSWQAYLLSAPIAIFSCVFAWGTVKDKNQLLKSSRGGYRVQIGKEADEFELPDQEGRLTRLSDFKDKRHVLLIFVRGDWCPGCHMMLRTYEKNNVKFQEKNILVMAIGPDPVGVNREMVQKLGLDFKVLSDEGQRTAMVYGVQLKEYENNFSEKYEEGIPLPASFLIDKQGLVRYVSRPDKVGEFLNPALIFPVVEQLDSTNGRKKETIRETAVAGEAQVTKEELKDHGTTIAALKKELSNYESIIDQANDAMIVLDIVDGKIHQSNPSAAQLLGYTKQELGKLSLFDLHPKESLDKSSRVVADVWEKGGLIYTDIPFVTKQGEIIPVECSAKVAPFAGRPAIVIYARDIRERLRMEWELSEQRKLIDEKNQDIKDSIEYSKRIQRSILMEREKIKAYAPQSFILFRPRDVVSGDFYWFHHEASGRDGNMLKVAAVDCTGHGVPGAFMSIIGNSLLNDSLNEPSITSPAKALDFVDAQLKKSLNKNAEDRPLRDGMDIALCFVDLEKKKLRYAGANNPLYLIRNKELIVINADKQPITASSEHEIHPFTDQSVDLLSGDTFYLFTDGYADQFGGEKGKKFMYKRFKETLVSLQDKSMDEQKPELLRIFQEWKGGAAQVDDVLLIGIRVP